MICNWTQHRTRPVGCALAALIVLVAVLPCFGAKAEAERKPPVIFTPAGGAFVEKVSVKLSAQETGATVRYTLDGSEPDETSPAFSKPLELRRGTLVRARAFPEAGIPSAIVAEAYTILADDLADFSSNLPLVIIDSFGTNITHEAKIVAGVQFFDAGKERTKLTANVNYSGPCWINIRGRASLRYPKNSFTVKTLNGDGDPARAALLGMPADSDWVLYAPYPDKTFMRDVLAYELHREMGHWAPRTRFVEVFVSQADSAVSRRDYVGVYVLMERIKRDKSRVDIGKLKADDNAEPRITGGYIFKKDHIDSGGGPAGGEGMVGVSTSTRAGFPTGPGGFPADPKGFPPAARVTTRSSSSSSSSSRRTTVYVTNHFGFPAHMPAAELQRDNTVRDDFESTVKEEESFKTLRRTNEFFFVEPEPDELTAVQKAWLKRHLNDVESALYGDKFRDPKEGYYAYIDPDSFIDYHMIVETTKNVDGFRFSVFFSKDRGGKIKADPIWDWNLSFGNANGKQGWIPEYWLWPQLDDKEYTWYRRLFEDPDFAQRYADRWAQFRTNVFATERVLARVDAIAAQLEEAQKRNFEKWPILGRSINPNYFVGSTYEEEVTWMKKYIQTRLDWIAKQFVPLPKLSLTKQGQGSVADLSVPGAEILFTLDGTDPRASGGAAASSAQAYKGAIELKPGTKLFARARDGERWSGVMMHVE
jgi:hypothetical protein